MNPLVGGMHEYSLKKLTNKLTNLPLAPPIPNLKLTIFPFFLYIGGGGKRPPENIFSGAELIPAGALISKKKKLSPK